VLIHELIEGNARRAPHDIAWQFGERRTTWAALEERTGRIAANLARRGVRAGDRMALLSETADTLAELFFALARCGVIAVPINPRSVLREVEFILSDVGARGLFVSAMLAPRLPPGPGARAARCRPAGRCEQPRLPVGVSALRASAGSSDPRSIDPLDQVHGGTTGTPKGCISSQQEFPRAWELPHPHAIRARRPLPARAADGGSRPLC
jgi:fatty-acyl-CoA synthase